MVVQLLPHFTSILSIAQYTHTNSQTYTFFLVALKIFFETLFYSIRCVFGLLKWEWERWWNQAKRKFSNIFYGPLTAQRACRYTYNTHRHSFIIFVFVSFACVCFFGEMLSYFLFQCDALNAKRRNWLPFGLYCTLTYLYVCLCVRIE